MTDPDDVWAIVADLRVRRLAQLADQLADPRFVWAEFFTVLAGLLVKFPDLWDRLDEVVAALAGEMCFDLTALS